MSNYERLYSMSQNLEYRIDRGQKADTEDIIGLFNIEKGTKEYDVCKSFLDSYEPLYRHKEMDDVPKASTRYMVWVGGGTLVTSLFGHPEVGALFGLWMAFAGNLYDSPKRSGLSDWKLRALHHVAAENLDRLQKK